MKHYIDTDDHTVFYIGTAIAKQHRMYIPDRYSRFDLQKTSYNFMTVYVGFERGMTDSGQPCWSNHGPTEFKTLDAVKQMAEANLGCSGGDFSLISDTIKFYKVYRRSIVKHFVEEVN